MITRTLTYKGHTIDKVVRGSKGKYSPYYLEYYTVDGKGFFGYLRDAKAAIDKMAQTLEDLQLELQGVIS